MSKVAVICCSVLCREVRSIFAMDFPDVQLEFLDSMLHMHPQKLQEALEEKLSSHSDPVLVIYGDCGPAMDSLEERFMCVRTPAVNCSELMLGAERYSEFRNQKIFLFLPEWATRWKEVFQKDLGFKNADLARVFMKENSKEICYLDTGKMPIPTETLREMEAFFDMPVRVVKETMNPLRKYIHEAMTRLERRVQDER
jgi:hypothetical protein